MELWFKKELNKADEYLNSKGFRYSDLRELYYKKIDFKNKNIDFRIKIPIKYPLIYPEFYLDDKSLYLTFPHIEKYEAGIGSSICYLEDTKKVPYLDGLDVIASALDRVEKIIKDYSLDIFDKKDFMNEFDSYWSKKTIYFLDLYEDDDMPKIHKITKCPSIFKNIITNNIEQTKEKLNTLGLKHDTFQSIIYLPFNTQLESIPYKYGQIMKLIEKHDYTEFFQQNFSLKNISQYIYFSFLINDTKHFASCKIDKRLCKNNYVIPKFSLDYNVERAVVKRIDRERIFLRGGNKTTSYISRSSIKIAIIGCGSLGGSLALKLAKSGIRNFTFIDYDDLDINNIARHICPMKYLNKNKVEALQYTILEHFPDCNIDIHHCNATNCLDVLDNQNLIISALGSDGTIFETFLLQIYEHIPKIISWFEGSIGGHAIFIRRKIKNFSDIIGKLKIVDNSKEKELIKDDIGCNSAYAPYAFIDAENTVTAIARMVTNFIIKKEDFIDQAWTMLGDLEENHGLISEKYYEKDSYSILKRDFNGNKL
ncbi:MAG: ThiF family adenylyltransferase [Campylobacteraceae bacterium]|nr:ThiF family adenylyltransferase [Campylobacteraceae bacterium]